MRMFQALLVAVLSVVPMIAHAEGMRVEPGLWEMKATTPGFFGSAPMEKVYSRCVRADSVTLERFVAELDGCRVLEPQITERSMKWKMSCPTEAGTMTGRGDFRSAGSTVRGTVEMAMMIGTQQIPMISSWAGKRLGPCR